MSEGQGVYNREDGSDKVLLYDLTVQSEWKSDLEPLTQPGKEKQIVNKSVDSSSGWSVLKSIGLAVSPVISNYLSSSFIKLVSSHCGWKFSVTQDGELLAILQDNCIEIRSRENEYTSVRNKWSLKVKDSLPQWRCLTWSPHSEMLAMSDSSGSILVYDEMGTQLCEIPSNGVGSEISNAMCSVIFKPVHGEIASGNDEGFDYELLAINYQGILTSYLICSQDGTSKLYYRFSFQDFHPDGVTCAVYHVTHSMLVIGGLAETVEVDGGDMKAAQKCGLSLWRNLSDSPHFKLVSDDDAMMIVGKRRPLMRRLTGHWYNWYSDGPATEYVYRMSVSPSGTQLVTLHQSGTVITWHLPSLRLVHLRHIKKQPGYDMINEELSQNVKKKKSVKDFLTAFHLSDIDWWSDDALILARVCGSVTVCSTKSFCNLLGASPEWFEPVPQVSRAGSGCFLGLECETSYVTLRRQQTVSDGGSEGVEGGEGSEDEDDDSVTISSKMSRYVTQGLYYVTDSERFQPPRRRPRFLSKTFRLIFLRSSTPEELYTRKINNEEYGDALQLAKAYNLDCDLVYQRQWRRATATVTTIQDYLSKIKKRSWVLHECLERVPEDLDAMQELLQYGLRGTDVEAMVAIGNKQDQGRFITSLDDVDDVYQPMDDNDYDDDDAIMKQKKELLRKIDFNNLTLDQQEVCRARRKLLQYNDRLQTYQAILGGYHAAPEKYDAKFFEKFRSESIIKLAVEYAQAGNAEALNLIFTYHGSETLPHRLGIIRNFPETCSPVDYQNLLPEASWEHDGMISWKEEKWRELDWCEKQEHSFEVLEMQNDDVEKLLYESDTDLNEFRGIDLKHTVLCRWYELRACEIECLSGQVDNALRLVNIAIEKNVPGLTELLADLEMMETLIYECRVDDDLRFSHLRQMEPLERVKLMMSKSTEEMFIKNVKKWLVPYLKKLNDTSAGSYYTVLRKYLVSIAEQDLTFCVHMFKASKQSMSDAIISDQCEHISIAMECIYSHTGTDQLEKAFEILVCLPQRGSDTSHRWSQLHDQLDELENHLRGAEILEKNALPHTVAFVRDSKSSAEEAVKVITRIMRTAARRESLGEMKLRKVLQDMCELRDKVYKCLNTSTCYEIFVESLLCSGSASNITLAGRMIQRDGHSTGTSHTVNTVSYEKSVELVLQAAREYFDSSANLSDSDMNLARLDQLNPFNLYELQGFKYSRACLELISDRNVSIEEERDLIEGVGMLQDLNISILPVQARMCTDRLQLVQRVLAADQHAYRNLPTLLKLGKLLRVTGGNELTASGQVLQLVTRAALKCNDYSVAYEACTQMIGCGYADAWNECLALAQTADYTDLQNKTVLLSFALSHCSPDLIDSILRERCSLQALLLREQIHGHIGERDSQSPPPVETSSTTGSSTAVKSAINQTFDIIESTNKATRTVLSQLGNKKFWTKTLKHLQPSKVTQSRDEFDKHNVDFTKFGAHPFYESLHDHCYVNNSEVNYSAISQSQKQHSMIYLHECILRAAKLEEMLEQCDNSQSVTRVLLLLAEEVIVQDSFLGLSYLLALPDPCQADECFENIPGTAISIQLAVYYYALHICSLLRTKCRPQVDDLYKWSPSKLYEAVLQYVQAAKREKQDGSWSPEVRQLVEKFLHHHDLLLDYVQAQMLQRINKGVDISRFVREDTYKKETILGMVMSMEEADFSTALSLAKRYKIPMSEVHMTHLEALFDDPSITTEQIQERVKQLGIMTELVKKKDGGCETFVNRMQQNVYPLIDGVDHDRLQLYYSLLSSLPSTPSPYASTVSAAQSHSKLLTRLHSVAPGINYKHIVDETRPLLDVLLPVLTADNYNSLATLANSVIKKDGTSLQASNVYRVWAAKLFMEGPQEKRLAQNMIPRPKAKVLSIFASRATKPTKIPVATTVKSEWIQRFELTEELQQKLSTDDFLAFILDITFTQFAYKQLVIDCRRQILRRAVKLSRQQKTTNRTRTSSRNIKNWEEVINELQMSLEHLDKLGYPPIQEMKASSDRKLHEYVCLFDLSRSDSAKIEELLMKILLDGQALEVVDDFVNAAKVEELTVLSALEKVVNIALESLGRPAGEAILKGVNIPAALKALVKVVYKHQLSGGTLAGCSDVTRIVKPFCSDSTIKCSVRLVALDILEQALEMTADDQEFLLQNRSDALVSSIDENLKVDESSLRTDDGRMMLYNQLLNSAQEMNQFVSISQLLFIWPKFLAASADLDDPGTNPWCRLIKTMLGAHPVESVTQVINIVLTLHKTNDLPCKCTRYVSDALLASSRDNSGAAVRCLLSSSFTELNEYAVQIIHQMAHDCEDEEVFDLIVKCCLLPNLTTSSIYHKLTDYILSKQTIPGEETSVSTPYYLHIDTVVGQLQEAGNQLEANSLLQQHRAANKSSTTLDTAINAFSRFFKR